MFTVDATDWILYELSGEGVNEGNWDGFWYDFLIFHPFKGTQFGRCLVLLNDLPEHLLWILLLYKQQNYLKWTISIISSFFFILSFHDFEGTLYFLETVSTLICQTFYEWSYQPWLIFPTT